VESHPNIAKDATLGWAPLGTGRPTEVKIKGKIKSKGSGQECSLQTGVFSRGLASTASRMGFLAMGFAE
jgi:hypothetical protein